MRIAAFLLVVMQLAGAAVPPRWTSGTTIWVWVDTTGAPADAPALIDRALAAWTSAADRKIALSRTRTQTQSRIRILFASRPGEFGETRPRIDPLTGTIVAADVVIATDTGIDDPVDRRIVLYLTLLHELGHGIGLRHTDNFSDIMYAFHRPDDGERYFGAYRTRLRSSDDVGTAPYSGLSANDVEAVRALYR